MLTGRTIMTDQSADLIVTTTTTLILKDGLKERSSIAKEYESGSTFQEFIYVPGKKDPQIVRSETYQHQASGSYTYQQQTWDPNGIYLAGYSWTTSTETKDHSGIDDIPMLTMMRPSDFHETSQEKSLNVVVSILDANGNTMSVYQMPAPTRESSGNNPTRLAQDFEKGLNNIVRNRPLNKLLYYTYDDPEARKKMETIVTQTLTNPQTGHLYSWADSDVSHGKLFADGHIENQDHDGMKIINPVLNDQGHVTSYNYQEFRQNGEIVQNGIFKTFYGQETYANNVHTSTTYNPIKDQGAATVTYSPDGKTTTTTYADTKLVVTKNSDSETTVFDTMQSTAPVNVGRWVIGQGSRVEVGDRTCVLATGQITMSTSNLSPPESPTDTLELYRIAFDEIHVVTHQIDPESGKMITIDRTLRGDLPMNQLSNSPILAQRVYDENGGLIQSMVRTTIHGLQGQLVTEGPEHNTFSYDVTTVLGDLAYTTHAKSVYNNGTLKNTIYTAQVTAGELKKAGIQFANLFA